MSNSNIACQDIQNDSSRWIGVANDSKNLWTRCLHELQILEENLEIEKAKRYKYHIIFKNCNFILLGLGSLVSGVTAGLPLLKWEVPSSIHYFLSILTFIIACSFWSRLEKIGNNYFNEGKDFSKLKEFCQTVRNRLNDVMADGKITNSERQLIRDMMGQMCQKSEEISSFNSIINLFKNQNDNKSYQNAFDGVSSIISQIGRSQQEMIMKAPDAIREYRESQLQVQIHSNAIPTVNQRRYEPQQGTTAVDVSNILIS